MFDLALLRRPWGWAALGWGLFAAALALYALRPRVTTVTRVEVQERVVTRTAWRLRLAAAPGATTTVQTDGTVSVAGPVVVDTAGEAEREATRAERREVVQRPAARWSVAAGVHVGPPWLGVAPSWWAAGGVRVLGPVWADAMIVMLPGGPAAGLALRIEF
jgi:hypothetical protein